MPQKREGRWWQQLCWRPFCLFSLSHPHTPLRCLVSRDRTMSMRGVESRKGMKGLGGGCGDEGEAGRRQARCWESVAITDRDLAACSNSLTHRHTSSHAHTCTAHTRKALHVIMYTQATIAHARTHNTTHKETHNGAASSLELTRVTCWGHVALLHFFLLSHVISTTALFLVTNLHCLAFFSSLPQFLHHPLLLSLPPWVASAPTL